ncbi:MAG: S8 family serine peptidase [Phycisphaeraceae bacterium]
MRMSKRAVTGSLVVGMLAGTLVLVDVMSRPGDARAQAGTSLTEPIPPTPAEDRALSRRHMLGWVNAKDRLQADMPMGRDIAVGQVEGNLDTGYLANTQHRDLPGTGFIPESGKSKLNGHATTVATYIAGPQSAGQGVRSVHAWTVNDWITAGYLNTGTTDNPRTDHPARVFNHSWISPKSPSAPIVLRRIDYQIDTQDVLVVAGVNNQLGEIPDLLASAYNTISVGSTAGKHSDALTTTEGEGRCKPEIVAPGNLTSWSTGVVTGVCAALLEYADRMVAEDEKGPNKDAAKSEVIKAALFAGAHRDSNWAPPEGEPLDRKFGAGVVDLDRALVILDGGHAEPDKPTKQRYGWSFATIEPGKLRTYTFTIDQEQGETGIALVWHRRVLGGKVNLVNNQTGDSREIWNLTAFVPNLNLGLTKAGPGGGQTMIATSSSQVDNVELIHVPKLDPGTYTLRIVRRPDDTKMAWDYAIAWRIEAK